MTIAIRDLEYFLAVADMKQLAKAAINLGLTSAALSKSISRLEKAAGIRLFERSPEGMQLTSAGRAIESHARAVCMENDDALRFATDVRTGRAGTIRIGATLGAVDDIVAPAVAHLQPKRPAMRAQITFGTPQFLLEELQHGHLDIVVVGSYEGLCTGLERRPIGDHTYSPLVRLGHPLLSRPVLRLEDLRGCSWIGPNTQFAARRRFNDRLRQAGLETPVASVEGELSTAWVVQVVRRTDLIGYVSTALVPELVGHHVCVLPIPELVLESTASYYLREGAYMSPILAEFIEQLDLGRLDPSFRAGAAERV